MLGNCLRDNWFMEPDKDRWNAEYKRRVEKDSLLPNKCACGHSYAAHDAEGCLLLCGCKSFVQP